MRLHHDFADSELRCDLLVEPSRDDEREHLAFTPRQGVVPRAKAIELDRVPQLFDAALHGVRERCKDRIAAERLREELDCASLNGP